MEGFEGVGGVPVPGGLLAPGGVPVPGGLTVPGVLLTGGLPVPGALPVPDEGGMIAPGVELEPWPGTMIGLVEPLDDPPLAGVTLGATDPVVEQLLRLDELWLCPADWSWARCSGLLAATSGVALLITGEPHCPVLAVPVPPLAVAPLPLPCPLPPLPLPPWRLAV